jgi:hypothetical protein
MMLFQRTFKDPETQRAAVNTFNSNIRQLFYQAFEDGYCSYGMLLGDGGDGVSRWLKQNYMLDEATHFHNMRRLVPYQAPECVFLRT